MAGDTHDDSDGATGRNRNMPADKTAKQSDITSSEGGKGGTHKHSGSYQPKAEPATLKSGIDNSGTGSFVGNADGTIEMGSQDPRRSHS